MTQSKGITEQHFAPPGIFIYAQKQDENLPLPFKISKVCPETYQAFFEMSKEKRKKEKV